ncbi:PqqD family peptide modification chaperone [Rathayibacter festucae]|uniref:PqqD family peptide modification chaperone n=1 Tax=Rathayibacter festucae TaxID=110937 RepID=UPI002A698AD0|nr:PqqD family peptide modification chaperone [Rathayibacter festucae]MDY0914247.1 PqqD family peptide modification chaperone [Rathayibacter festucae]
MTRDLTIAPFGLGVRLSFDDTVPDAVIARFQESWSDVTDVAERPGSAHRVSLTEPEGVAGVIAQPTEEALAEHLGAALTVAAVDACRGRLLSIHASALALSDGRVVAFTGRPGAGKSTLISLAGRRFGYLTDETVAVRRDGTVLPFRKPIALHAGTSGWKRHRSPAASGMLPLPAAPLRLAGLWLLARDAGGPDAPVLEEVGFDEALRALLPELSWFAELPSALHHLAALVDAIGGVRRLRYREAESVLPLLDGVGEPAAVVTEGWEPERAPSADGAPGAYRRDSGTEWIERDGVVSCLRGTLVESLTGIAPVLWRTLEGPASLEELTAAVVAEHGAPPGGDAGTAVQAVLAELVERGLVAGVPARG